MFKIKLLILLLSSAFLFSCSHQKNLIKNKYSLAYVGGSVDGLLLNNLLINHLKNLKLYDQHSTYVIEAQIKHSDNLYITNIDNTSDRKKILSYMSVRVINKKDECIILNVSFSESQFYIFSTNDKFLSNQKAEKEIRRDNTENLVKKLINNLDQIDLTCA